MAIKGKSKGKDSGAPTRARRSEEERIADLEAKIAALKVKAERKKVQRDPALRHIHAAVRSIDKALSATGDAATRGALTDARGALSAVLALSGLGSTSDGAAPSRARSSVEVTEEQVLAYVKKHPGQRGEQISQALGTDSASVRPVMKRLIAAGKIKASGQARATSYQLA